MRLGPPLPSRGRAFDPDVPTPGCYRVRLRRRAADSAVRIWLGHGVDEATGDEASERPLHWQCSLNGARVPLEQCWPGCAREPITREEHDRIVERNRTMDEASPFYSPTQRIDLSTAPPPTF
jgi:hypothetical protein